MAAPSENDDALLISNEETELSTGAEVSEEDGLFSKYPDGGTNQYHSSTENQTIIYGQTNIGPGRFGGIGRWAKVLLKWWRTLVIILTPLILLLLFAVAEDTRVRRSVV